MKIFGGKPVALLTTCPIEFIENGFDGDDVVPPPSVNAEPVADLTEPEPPDLQAHGLENPGSNPPRDGSVEFSGVNAFGNNPDASTAEVIDFLEYESNRIIPTPKKIHFMSIVLSMAYRVLHQDMTQRFQTTRLVALRSRHMRGLKWSRPMERQKYVQEYVDH